MGSRTTVTLFDDIDGTNEGVRTVTLSLDGQVVEVNLSEANHAKVQEFLAPYLAAGRKTRAAGSSGRQGSTPAAASGKRDDNQTVREWAEANGTRSTPAAG